jgi:hypothetical protein
MATKQLEPQQHGHETIEATQQRLDNELFSINHRRNTFQQSEASVREKLVALRQLRQQQRSLISSSTTTDRSNEHQQQLNELQVKIQNCTKAEKVIRDKLDQLEEEEAQHSHKHSALIDRIILDRAAKDNQVEEERQQEEARAIAERMTRLIEEQTLAVRQLQEEEDDEQKRTEQPGETKTSYINHNKEKTKTKRKIIYQSNPTDNKCSICWTPVRYIPSCNDCFIPTTNKMHLKPLFFYYRTPNNSLIGLMNLFISCVNT